MLIDWIAEKENKTTVKVRSGNMAIKGSHHIQVFDNSVRESVQNGFVTVM